MTSNAFAFDRRSVRSYDKDGRLHVSEAKISKATVNNYFGREIPGGEALGLDPEKSYRVFRDPTELAKATSTFNNIPILDRHIPHTAETPRQDDVIGTTGSEARFEDPYLVNSLAFWVSDAISDIEEDERRELSCSYRYKPVVESGVYGDLPFDIRMTDIVGNHVNLCPEGRAGHDVMVEDTAPLDIWADSAIDMETTHGASGSHNDSIVNPEFMKMPKGQTTSISTKAGIVLGALAAHMAPRLAADAKPDLAAIVRGTTAANYARAKPVIVARLKAATAGKLAKDANLDDVHGLLDRLDGVGGEGEDAEEESGMGGNSDPEEELDNPAIDSDPAEMICNHLRGKISPELLAEIEQMADAARPGEDEDPEPVPSNSEEMKKMTPADRKAAVDSFKAAHDKWTKDRRARDAKKAKDAQAVAEMRKAEEAKDKQAMDTAIRVACESTEKRTIKRMRDLAEAEQFIRPYVGDAVIMAQDSAEDVYRLALDELGVSTKGVHPSAYRTILEAMGVPGAKRAVRGARGADDARAAVGSVTALMAKDTNFGRLRRIA